MYKKMFAGLTLIALLAAAVLFPVAGYAAQADQSKAEKFIEIAKKALEQTIKLKDRAQEKGLDVTAANALIAEGEALLNKAKTAFSSNDFPLTFEKAKQAQARFRDALETFETPMTEEEQESEKGKGILVAISNSEERIQRIRDVLVGVTSTQENQVYIDWVNANITEAEQNLTDAKTVLETTPINVTLAAQMHADANRDIEEAFKALKMIGDWTVNWRAESFLNGLKNARERITNELNNAAMNMYELENETRNALNNAAMNMFQLENMTRNMSELENRTRNTLNNATMNMDKMENSIQSAKEKLLSGDKQGAIEDIKNARNIIQETTRELANVMNMIQETAEELVKLQTGEQGKVNGKP